MALRIVLAWTMLDNVLLATGHNVRRAANRKTLLRAQEIHTNPVGWEADLIHDQKRAPAEQNRTGHLMTLGEGGFSLQVLTSTANCLLPKPGDQVTVHYSGSLAKTLPGKNTTIFDSSRARHQPFTFILGRGKVIRGWDQGIVHFCLGERGILHVPSYKGYGSMGAPPAIPPEAALDFDVELLAINDINAPGYNPPTQAPPKHSSASSFGISAFALLAGAFAMQ
mmetsp:Transcript_110907/g.214764  ORF Transcript_110907/g.214764 Transcript_110907/m.214764 type:complete len:224 (+) Transcript_110907:100-771(+)